MSSPDDIKKFYDDMIGSFDLKELILDAWRQELKYGGMFESPRPAPVTYTPVSHQLSMTNPLAVDEDFIIPIKPPRFDDRTPAQKKQDEESDMEYLRTNLYRSMGIPKKYLEREDK